MSGELSDYSLSAIEYQAEQDARRINAGISDDQLDPNPQIDICDNCPLVGFPLDELSRTMESTGWSADYPGQTTYSVTFESESGKRSKEILLGSIPGNTMTGRAQHKIRTDAARRTQECSEPRKVPKILGPLAVKKCQALEKYKTF